MPSLSAPLCLIVGCTLSLALPAVSSALPADPAPPVAVAAPQLSAIPGFAQVYLSWPSVDGATAYNVYSSDAAITAANQGSLIMTIAAVAKSNAQATLSLVVSGLGASQNKPVHFVVVPVVGGAEKTTFADVSATPSFAATPDPLVVTAEVGAVKLEWTPIGATSYTVYQATAGPDLNSLNWTKVAGQIAITANVAEVANLTPGTVYFFKVTATASGLAAPTQSSIRWAAPTAGTPVARAGGNSRVDHASCKPEPGSAIAQQIGTTSGNGANTSNTAGVDVFSKFSTTASNGATQASAQIVNGYINAWMKADSNSNCGITNAISVEVSATAPVTTSTFLDYAREEMLGRRSGIVNIYFNPFAGRDKNNPYYDWNDRRLNSDHVYIEGLTAFSLPGLKGLFRTIDDKLRTDPKGGGFDNAWDQALPFYSFGIGGRGVKTALQGSSTAAVGTIYFGFGIDGPFHDSSAAPAGGSSGISTAGGLSFEAYVTGNLANRNALNTMFATTDSSSKYGTVGSTITFWATGKLFFSLEYDKGLGSFGQRVLRDEALFRFGYGSPSAATPK